MTARTTAMQQFQTIPGVGVKIAEDFWNIGLRSLADLEDADPQKIYDRICKFQGCKVDRCMLYVARCAVYFASNAKHDPEKLKWWHWRDN